jgi:phosphoribosylpyrophosphate synthetase
MMMILHQDHNVLNGKIAIILADDGAATGATVIAAARWIKKKKDGQKVFYSITQKSKNILDRGQEIDATMSQVILEARKHSGKKHKI